MRKWLFATTIMVTGLFITASAFAANPTANSSVDATIAAGTSTISVTSSLSFGTITPTELDHRKAAGPLTIDFFVATSPWEIYIYSDNGVVTGPGELGGLIGEDGSSLLALKVWTANYGRKTGAPNDPDCPAAPDADHDDSWEPGPVGDGWNYVFDKNNGTKRELIDQDAQILGTFDAYLACDAQNMAPQVYGTTVTGHPEYGKITVELRVE